jgi:site-specific recombinase XerD
MAKGIVKKRLKNGETHLYVRFKYLSKIYPVKNFTKLFGCLTIKQVEEQLSKIKIEISKGNDPFILKSKILNDIFYNFIAKKLKNKEWREITYNSYLEYYERFIKKRIGDKYIERIDYKDLINIREDLEGFSASYKNRLKLTLNPIFKEAIKKQDIFYNPIEHLENVKKDKREKIRYRTFEDNLTIIKKMYKMILDYNFRIKETRTEYKTFYLLSLFSAHRIGELTKLRKEDIYISKNLIISNSGITKTKIDSHFPIPTDCFEYIKNIEKGLIFPNVKYSSLCLTFQKMIKKSDIEMIRDKKLSPHDIRRLFLQIMIKQGFDSRLVDSCLDHQAKGVIDHYLDFEYSQKLEVFNKYWELIKS